MIALGGAIEVAEYGASASEGLAEKAVQALGDRTAVLLRHHGVLGCGATLDEAVTVVELVERIAQIRALTQAIGSPAELPSDISSRNGTCTG